jgi:hypothetical protein
LGTGQELSYFVFVLYLTPITLANAFALSDTGFMGSNPSQGMDVCMRLFCVYVILYIGSGLARG